VEREGVFVHEGEVREEGVVHVLEEEGCVVEGVEGYAVGSGIVFVSDLSVANMGCWAVEMAYNFTSSSCSFLGSMSSMYGSNLGYSSRTLERIAR
jgi:hypothetical protein